LRSLGVVGLLLVSCIGGHPYWSTWIGNESQQTVFLRSIQDGYAATFEAPPGTEAVADSGPGEGSGTVVQILAADCRWLAQLTMQTNLLGVRVHEDGTIEFREGGLQPDDPLYDDLSPDVLDRTDKCSGTEP
jgi:hypothetical protein